MELPTAESVFGKPLKDLNEDERHILRITKSICLWRSPKRPFSQYTEEQSQLKPKKK